MRLYVTGQNSEALGVIIHEEDIPRGLMEEEGAPGVQLWATKGTGLVPFDKELKGYSIDPATYEGEDTGMPGPGDTSFFYAYIGPGEKTPWHATDSIDHLVVISGEVWLIMEDGREVCVKAGDCVVQLGVPHIWENRGEVGCWNVITSIGATRK